MPADNNIQTLRLMVINGPNLNLLGRREPDIYGHETLADIEAQCRKTAAPLAANLTFFQSNHEGALVDEIQKAFLENYDGVIINAAAYTHTSVAIHDALKMLTCPIIELHISDPETREDFRHHSYIAPLAVQIIKGHGTKGYYEAILALCELCRQKAGDDPHAKNVAK